LELTKYIRTFVAGLYPTPENHDVAINSAIKTYYASKLTQKRRKRVNPDLAKLMTRNQRRIHKSKRRKKALYKHVSADTISDDKKKNYALLLTPDMMSSKEEKEDDDGARYFVVHKPTFRSRRFERLLKKTDEGYLANCSRRSKDQYVRRKVGLPSEREAPTFLPDDTITKFLI